MPASKNASILSLDASPLSIRILDAKVFVPLRFTIIFYSKIFGIEPTHDPPPVSNRRTMGKA